MTTPTGNSILAIGYVMGCLMTDDSIYKVVEADAANAQATIEHTVTGNRYRVTVEQISGEE